MTFVKGSFIEYSPCTVYEIHDVRNTCQDQFPQSVSLQHQLYSTDFQLKKVNEGFLHLCKVRRSSVSQ